MLEDTRKTLVANLASHCKQKYVVAMSGGVDSSVVAALLHDAGHDVIGVTLQLYSADFEVRNTSTCCAGKDIYDAQMTAAKIGIPHYVFNYEHNFKAEVIDKFVDSYVSGETPIPCVLCNQKVKFRDLLKAAHDLGADKMATGHYVQRLDIDNVAQLHRGKDVKKDQSYFLFATTGEQLAMLEFPLGGLEKEQTREIAHYYGLVTADKPDSQDICFVPGGNYREVVTQLHPNATREGSIVLYDGTVLGRHNGIINYTVGQRKGLNISHHSPLYVIRIDPKKNEVIVGEKSMLNAQKILIRDVNWLVSFDNHIKHGYTSTHEVNQNLEIECVVKLRSSHGGATARIIQQNNSSAIVELHEKYPGVTPGQACVAYQDTRVLGGGWIVGIIK